MLKFDKFVSSNEAKQAKSTDDIKKTLDELFDKCPTIKKSGELWPEEKCLYSLSGVKTFVKDKVEGLKDNTKTDQIFQTYHKSAKNLKSISVKNYEYGSYPYYYNSEKVTEEEAKKKKEEYEKYSEEHSTKKKKVEEKAPEKRRK